MYPVYTCVGFDPVEITHRRISKFRKHCVSKMTACRSKRKPLGLRERSDTQHLVYLWQYSVQDHFEVIRCISNFWPCTNVSRQLLAVEHIRQIFGLQWKCLIYTCYFNSEVFKVMLRSYVTFPMEWNGWNLGLGRHVATDVLGTIDLEVFRIILGSFGAIVSKWCITATRRLAIGLGITGTKLRCTFVPGMYFIYFSPCLVTSPVTRTVPYPC